MGRVLILAGAYNLLWGALAIGFPSAMFRWAGMEPPNYPWLWQCIGMIVGVYGVGYAIAASAPFRHWPIVLVGLLGKIFGPIGFVGALASGLVTPAFGLNIVCNDLVWWLPFGAILHAAWRHHQRGDPPASPIDSGTSSGGGTPSVSDAMGNAILHDGPVEAPTLLDYTWRRPVLIVFLRHFGCTFCREALADLAERKGDLDARGVGLVVVHMVAPGLARASLVRHGLGPGKSVAQISDPGRTLYRAFELGRGTLRQVLGPSVWIRGLLAAIFGGHGIGGLQGDGFQMPGVFLVHRGRVLRSFRHSNASSRPEYSDLAACEI